MGRPRLDRSDSLGKSFKAMKRYDVWERHLVDLEYDAHVEHCLIVVPESDYDALEAQVESLQNKWASRPLSSEDQAAYIAKLEAALKDIAVWQSDLADAKKVAAWALGLTAETKGDGDAS